MRLFKAAARRGIPLGPGCGILFFSGCCIQRDFSLGCAKNQAQNTSFEMTKGLGWGKLAFYNGGQEMQAERVYYVYILASATGTLYVGITSNLEGRMFQHKSRRVKGFTQKYKVKKLLYYEEFDDVYQAIEREKQIKNWRREKKVALFEETNPGWVDLSKDWFND